jgi:hypothetical protein
MTQYAGQPKIATTIPLPDANTPFNASAIGAPIAANRDSIVALTSYGFYKTTLNTAKPPYPLAGEHVNSGLYKLSGAINLSAAKGYYRAASANARFNSTHWKYGYDTVIGNDSAHTQLETSTTGDVSDLVFFFELPDGIALKRASIRMDGKSPHVGMPSVLPRLEIWLHDVTTGNGALVAGADDNAANVAAYEALHTFSVTLPNTAVDASKHIVTARVSGEFGTNEVEGLVVLVPVIEWERTWYAEEFGAIIP